MVGWFYYSLGALLLLGGQRFLNKVAAERQCSSALTTAVFMGTVTLLSCIAFVLSPEALPQFSSLLVLSLVNSVSFALATIAHIEALRHFPAGIVFPLTRLSLVAVVAWSVCVLGERLNSWQWLGVVLAFAVVGVLAAEAGKETRPNGSRRLGFFFVVACVICATAASVSSKMAAVSTSKAGFMAMSYLFGTFFSLAIDRRWGKGNKGYTSDAVKIGIAMGVLNFFGFYAFLAALERGPLSAVAPIAGMHFVVAIILSVLIYHERMTLPRSLGAGLTLLAIILLSQSM